MKKIKLLLLSLSFIVSFFYPSLTFAQLNNDEESFINYSNPRVDIADITYSETIYGSNASITGSFNIINKNKFDIGNVYYEIALMGRDSERVPFQKAYSFSDRIGPFFISASGQETIDFSFELPKNKPSENVALRFSAFLKNNKKLGWSLKDFKMISDVSSQVYVVNPEFRIGKEVLSFMYPNTIYKGEEASFVYGLKNDSNEDIRVEPKVIVKELRNQKEDYATYYENKVTVPARGSVKVFSNVRVFEDDPGIYAAQINFIDESGDARGIPIVFQYVVDGNILSINSIVTEPSNNLIRGKNINVHILYTGKPNDVRNPSADRVINDASVYIKVTNKKGDVISESNELHNFDPVGELVVPLVVKKNSEGFDIEVKVTKDGETLAEEILNVPAPVRKEGNSIFIIVVSIILVIALAVFIVIKKKIKIKNIKLPWLKMFMFLVLFLGVANISSAQTIPTASITSSSNLVYRGEASPLLTWSSSNGSSYVTNRTTSGTVCTGITTAVWTGKGNTASGTGYAYPSTGATTANVSGSSTVNCTVTYTYNVTSPTGNVTTSAVSIVYIPTTRPTANINFSGQSNISVGIGAPIPQITWVGTGGKTTGGYSTSVSVNNSSQCPGIVTGTWTGKGNTASGSAYAQPATVANTPAPSNLLGCVVSYTYVVTPTTGPAVTAVATMSFVNSSSATASITSSSIQVYRGEASPLLTWTSSNGSSYVTNRTTSGTVCTGITTAVWTGRGNTASGTGYAYPSTTGATAANVSGTSTINCTVTYTYNVTSSTGNVTTSAVSIVYIPTTRPTASINIGGSTNASIGIGAPIPQITWVGTGGKTTGGYSTSVSVNNSSQCPGIVTGTWTGKGNTASGSIVAQPGPTATTVPSNLLGCVVTYTYRSIPTTGPFVTAAASMSFVSSVVPTASLKSYVKTYNTPSMQSPRTDLPSSFTEDTTVFVGEEVPKLVWSSSNGFSYRTRIWKTGTCSATIPISQTYFSGASSSGYNYAYPPNVSAVPGKVPANMAGCNLEYTYEVTSSTGNIATSTVVIQYRAANSNTPRPTAYISASYLGSTTWDSVNLIGEATVKILEQGNQLQLLTLWGPRYDSTSYDPPNWYIENSPYQKNLVVNTNSPTLCPGITDGQNIPVFQGSKQTWETDSITLPPATRNMEGCDLKYTFTVTNSLGYKNSGSLIVKYRTNPNLKPLNQYDPIDFSPMSVVYPSYLLENPIKTYENSLWSGIDINKIVLNPWEPSSVYVDINSTHTVGSYLGIGPDGVSNAGGLFIGYVPVGLNGGQIPSQYTAEGNDETAFSNFWEQARDNKAERVEVYRNCDGTGCNYQGSFIHGGWDGGTYPLYMYLRYPSPVWQGTSDGGSWDTPFGFNQETVNCRQGIDSTNCTSINLGPSVLLTDDVVVAEATNPGDSAYCYASIDNGLTQVEGVSFGQPVTWHFKLDKPGVDVSGVNSLCTSSDCINGKEVSLSSTIFRWTGDTGDNPVPAQNNYTPPSWINNSSSICSQMPVDNSELGLEDYYSAVADWEGYYFNSATDKCCIDIFAYASLEDENNGNQFMVSYCKDVPETYPNTWSNVPKLSTSYSVGSVNPVTNIVDMELQYVTGGGFYEYEWDYLQCKPLAVGGDICPNIVGTQPILPAGFSMAPSDAVITSGLATIADRRCFPTSLAMLNPNLDLSGTPKNIRNDQLPKNVRWSFVVDSGFFQGTLNNVLYTIPRFATITWSGDINENDPNDIDEYSEFINGAFSGNSNDKNVVYSQNETTPTVTVTIEDEFGSWSDTSNVTIGECTGQGCLTPCPVPGPIPCSTNNVPGDEAVISNFTINPSIANENNQCTLSWTTGAYTDTCTIKGSGGDIPIATSTSPQSINVDPGIYTLSCLNHAPEITTAGPRTCLQNPDLREN